jgi:two-component system, NarL family, nitrate/nitrite sensor histidine kinase NarX
MLDSNHRLGNKLTAILVGYLVVAIVAVGLTLLMSWQLEGGAAAVNEMGSERMRSYRIALLASLARPPTAERERLAQVLRAEIGAFERVLADLEQGDPSRPLLLPREPAILTQFAALKQTWLQTMRPALERLLATEDAQRYLALERELLLAIDGFVPQVDAMVRTIEQNISTNTRVLRMLQFGLIALSVVGTIALIYLMYLLIIRPVTNLEDGMQRMESGDFSVRLPVETRDELGALAAGFNRMAEHLQELYGSLERRVAEKTRTLEDKNKELGTLYESAALLAQPAALETLCRDFVRKLIGRMGADGGAVRLVEPDSGKLHLFLQEGMPGELVEAERCLQKGECLCGEGVKRPHASVHILVRGAYRTEPYRCREAGFATVGVFPIRFRDQNLGVFNLYHHEPRDFSAAERHMLETLGQHLGIAVQNQRLASREKEMAISEERNLLAQELHDSIAQSLAFLNLQAQMLEDSLEQGSIHSAREELARIREGIQESYDDVRELLVHFRTRMAESDVETAIASSLLRFEQQTRIKTKFSQSGVGLPLAPEAQLQVMHIVQESLSNARKHSRASSVEIEMLRGPVYRFRVRDDGEGFDPAAVPGDLHVGLRIMRERARRIGGELEVHSAPGRGTQVVLTLPVLQAQAA